MKKKISYRAVPIERLTSALLAAMLSGATKLVVAIDVAKLKMMAGFGPEDGTIARLVRFESLAQTRAFVALVIETGKAPWTCGDARRRSICSASTRARPT